MELLNFNWDILDLSKWHILALNYEFCHLHVFSQVEFNPNQSSLTVEGDDIDAFDKVMQHISYLNSRQFPTPGIRHLRISTTVKWVAGAKNTSPVVF